MTRGTDRFKDFRVHVEYTDGTVYEWDVNRTLWYMHLQDALERDENVEHYTVEKVYE